MDSALKNWQEKEFNEFIKSKKNGVVEFGAPWCAACKLIEPIIRDLAQDHKDIFFARIDVAKNAGVASKMGVMSLPNILFIKDGKVIDQMIGSANKKDLLEKIKKFK